MQTRRAAPGDEPILRALRIQALTDAPEGADVIQLLVIHSNCRAQGCYERSGF